MEFESPESQGEGGVVLMGGSHAHTIYCSLHNHQEEDK